MVGYRGVKRSGEEPRMQLCIGEAVQPEDPRQRGPGGPVQHIPRDTFSLFGKRLYLSPLLPVSPSQVFRASQVSRVSRSFQYTSMK